MNSYEFSMENILKWREDTEKSNMENLANVQNELRHQKSIRKDLLKERENLKSNRLKYKDISQLKFQNLYTEKVEDKIQDQDKIINNTKDKLENVRQELIESQKERKIMENLKERDFESYKNKINIEEQKELDEITVLKHRN